MMYLIPALTLRRREALRAERLVAEARKVPREEVLDEFGYERFLDPLVQGWFDKNILDIHYNQ